MRTGGGGGRHLFPALTLALLAFLALAALLPRSAEAQTLETYRTLGTITSGVAKDLGAIQKAGDAVPHVSSQFNACAGDSNCQPVSGNWKFGYEKLTNVGITVGGGDVTYDGTPIEMGPIRLFWWYTGSAARVVTIMLAQPSSSAPASSGPTIYRSSPLTLIADNGPTEWWFPVGRGTCAMKDEQRPWTWKRWRAPTADRCGWLSLPEGSRQHFDEPVDELAFAVYTALVASPDLSGQAATKAPSGRKLKLQVWGVYPHPERTTNSTSRFKGPYTTPLTVCLPGAEDQVIAVYDPEQRQWAQLDTVEAQHEGHVCGLLSHDLGLLAVTKRSD